MIFWWVPVFVCVTLLHELGHVVAFSAYGERVTIRVHWYGFEAGNWSNHWRLTPVQNVIVLAAGILLGAAPLLWFGVEWLYLLYVGACLADVGEIIVMLKVPLTYWRQPYYAFVKEQLRVLERGSAV